MQDLQPLDVMYKGLLRFQCEIANVFVLQCYGLLTPSVQIYNLCAVVAKSGLSTNPQMFKPADSTLPVQLVQLGRPGPAPHAEAGEEEPWLMTTDELAAFLRAERFLKFWRVALLEETCLGHGRMTGLAVKRDFGAIGDMPPPPPPKDKKLPVEDQIERDFWELGNTSMDELGGLRGSGGALHFVHLSRWVVGEGRVPAPRKVVQKANFESGRLKDLALRPQDQKMFALRCFDCSAALIQASPAPAKRDLKRCYWLLAGACQGNP